MMDTPSTKPGKTMGKDAKLSSSQRPRIFVLTTIQQTTEANNITTVAVVMDIHRLFKAAARMVSEPKMYL